ncbi:MAG: EboA domain-containing protein [Betaproteobacteria bacterium]|nr:EboA domain-containing protein [Betaproteobacteria bacterium]
MTPELLLKQWLESRLPADAQTWLADAAAKLRNGSDTELYRSISLVTRKIGKADLAPTTAELKQAGVAREGWNPSDWSLDQAARIYLLLMSGTDGATFLRRLDQLCNTADVGELVAFYRGLPLYPDQSRYVLRAAEGIRTNMKAVFEAVAHRNPYPAEQLSEPAWNQMVLKTLFIGSTLHPIVDLDRRANPVLARMLCDYAHERWAAGRPISPELWRCVGPHATGDMLRDLGRVLEKGTAPERNAAALALASSPDPAATGLLWAYPELSIAVSENKVSWQTLAGSA